ncbi:MAG TPA: hypothetical protein VEY91_10425, partial [Candidatus Limnocylindria bacterium]|nr:hypothetical protein [Candidatus Limnocylindria bacterium]
IVAVMGCRSSAALPSRPLSQLRSAPTTVTVGARTLALSAELWRDFMPISPPDGKPMIATLRIATEDGTGLPPGLKADSTWVLHGEHVWETLAVEQEPRAAGASRIEILAREGPKWGPEIQVDVVVRIVDAEGRVSLLRAPNQNVARAS